MPSGILCSAIEMANITPSLISLELVKNVAIPSGILCITMAKTEKIPSLYKLLFSLILLLMFLLINRENIIPTFINTKEIIKAKNI